MKIIFDVLSRFKGLFPQTPRAIRDRGGFTAKIDHALLDRGPMSTGVVEPLHADGRCCHAGRSKFILRIKTSCSHAGFVGVGTTLLVADRVVWILSLRLLAALRDGSIPRSHALALGYRQRRKCSD
jgi:hypothetical protein